MKNVKACKGCRWKKTCRTQCALLPEGCTCGECETFSWCRRLFDVDRSGTVCVNAPHTYKRGEPDE